MPNPDLSQSEARLCPCGARAFSQRECLDSDDEILRYVGEMYLGGGFYFCADEDDVLKAEWTCATEDERQRRFNQPGPTVTLSPFDGLEF